MENNIGRRILEVRIKKDYTQEQLAEKIGTVPSYISNLERGNKCPSLSLLRKIVKELDTSYDYVLMDDFKKSKQLEIRYHEMFKNLSSLNENTQEEFFSITNKLIESFKNIENK